MSRKAVWIGFVAGLAILAFMFATGYAEGGMGSYTVQNENLVVENEYGIRTAYIYAEIVNTGSTNIELDESVAFLNTEDGSPVTQTTSIRMVPEVLKPGATGYLYAYEDLHEAAADPTEVKFSVKAADARLYEIEDCNIGEPYFTKEKEFYRETTYMDVVVNNDTDAPMYDFTVCFITKEKDTGKIVGLDIRMNVNVIGIPAKSSVIVRQEKYSMDEIDTSKYELSAIGYITKVAK